MSQETEPVTTKTLVTLEFNRYTVDGRPTCRTSKEDACPFMMYSNFGMKVSCFFDDNKENLYPNDGVSDYSVPFSTCPLNN